MSSHSPVVSAGVIIFRRSRGILLLKKPRFWEFPKGRVDGGDADLLHTALREAKEEAGISDLKLVEGFQEQETYNISGKPKIVTYWLATTSENPRISREHLGYAWCSPEEARRLLTYAGKRRVLDRALALLKKKGLLREDE